MDWQDIIEHSPLAVLTLGPTDRITYANPAAAKLFGSHSPDALNNLQITDLLPASESSFQDARTRACGVDIQLGAPLHCVLHVAPSPDGALTLYLVGAVDNAKTQQDRIQAEKLAALQTVAGGVAHELNNPLTGVLGYAQILLAGATDPKTRTRLEQITAEAQRCRAIVQGLLDFSRHYDTQRTKHDISNLLNDLLDMRAYQLGVDNIRIQRELAANLPKVFIDPSEIQRAFLNIINNAHQALRKTYGRDRVMTVTSAHSPASVLIQFHDTGCGIPSGDLPKIFDPFFTTQAFGEGLGLGLSVAYGVIRDHNGQIQIDSEPDRFTRVSITLPTEGIKG